MRISASDIVSLYRPTQCALRLFLRSHGVKEGEPGAYDEVIRTLGLRHEAEHLESLGAYKDISLFPHANRVAETSRAIHSETAVIYQGVLEQRAVIGGREVLIVGHPDFLIRDGGGYVIRDSKLSRRVGAGHHEEIALQLQLYGWLYEQTTGNAPLRLEVHAGGGDIVHIPYDGGNAAMSKLDEVVAIKALESEPYEPVGWSKCKAGCGYSDRCWSAAEERSCVSLVGDVDQGLARKLHAVGVDTPQSLLSEFDVMSLSELRRPWGSREQKVGKKASTILLNAEALATGQERLIAPIVVPEHKNYVMFDLEGLPPHQDDLEKIFLWGMQVYGTNPGTFIGVTSGFGIDGDREGWEAFLHAADMIFTEYGDLPFLHWHHYERVHIEMYVNRYGDPDGVASRVQDNLLDLLPITKRSIILPLPSYSLKVVEEYVGFRRAQAEYGGSWAMAKFILATETEDCEERARLMAKILRYNEEDLAATWAVFLWLRSMSANRVWPVLHH